MKDNICKHCGAVNQHFSFQCHTQRKPIKKGDTFKDTKISYDSTGAPYYKEFRVVDVKPSDGKINRTKIKSKPVTTSKPKGKESLPELLKLAEIVFNRWIRNRDKGDNGYFQCMCCGKQFPNDEMDAGHLYAKTYSRTRFEEDNVWGQAQSCNRLNYGNHEKFKARLIEHIGEARVNRLTALTLIPVKWSRSELQEIINRYK